MEGQRVCYKHGGASIQAREKALIRVTIDKAINRGAWKLEGHPTADPGETLLLLISAWKVRLAEVSDAIQGMVDKAGGNLEKALTAETWVENSDGQSVKVGEHLKGLVELEHRIASQLAQWSAVAIKANLEERRVIVQERNGAQFASMLRVILSDARLGLNAQQRAELPKALERMVIDHEMIAC